MNRTIPLILAVALFMENMDSTVIATSAAVSALSPAKKGAQIKTRLGGGSLAQISTVN
ncbi:hypothetical protein [Mesorhizobium sp.]|uniref:hypothetical protein n=1 Tax=Mesorhizobium sp. TaxID=1871066 RepID=UPI0025C1956F|nr:hypothetical protein [Mesorhizobium sp.]